MTTQDIYVSSGQAARYLGVSSSAIRLWAAEGLLSYQLTPGGHRRFYLPDVLKLGAQRQQRGHGHNDHQK